jgi:hypothetical protein
MIPLIPTQNLDADQRARIGYTRILDLKATKTIVAEIDGAIVGFIGAKFKPRTY